MKYEREESDDEGEEGAPSSAAAGSSGAVGPPLVRPDPTPSTAHYLNQPLPTPPPPAATNSSVCDSCAESSSATDEVAYSPNYAVDGGAGKVAPAPGSAAPEKADAAELRAAGKQTNELTRWHSVCAQSPASHST